MLPRCFYNLNPFISRVNGYVPPHILISYAAYSLPIYLEWLLSLLEVNIIAKKIDESLDVMTILGKKEMKAMLSGNLTKVSL